MRQAALSWSARKVQQDRVVCATPADQHPLARPADGYQGHFGDAASQGPTVCAEDRRGAGWQDDPDGEGDQTECRHDRQRPAEQAARPDRLTGEMPGQLHAEFGCKQHGQQADQAVKAAAHDQRQDAEHLVQTDRADRRPCDPAAGQLNGKHVGQRRQQQRPTRAHGQARHHAHGQSECHDDEGLRRGGGAAGHGQGHKQANQRRYDDCHSRAGPAVLPKGSQKLHVHSRFSNRTDFMIMRSFAQRCQSWRRAPSRVLEVAIMIHMATGALSEADTYK